MPLSKSTDACVVMVTCGTEEEAERIARTLVTEKLAGCVNLLGSNQSLRSFFIWENKLNEEAETLLIIKTRLSALSTLEKRIGELHSYDTPEFIALPIQSGSSSYLEWLLQGVSHPS